MKLTQQPLTVYFLLITAVQLNRKGWGKLTTGSAQENY